jgi:hypothetical protein
MKLSKIATTLLGAAVVFGTAVLAGEVNKGTLNVEEKLNVQGKPLDPGSYKLEWTGTGPTVQVTVSQGKQTIATFPAQATEQANKNASNAYGSAAQADGSKELTTIYIGGRHTVLQVGEAAAGNAQAATPSAK